MQKFHAANHVAKLFSLQASFNCGPNTNKRSFIVQNNSIYKYFLCGGLWLEPFTIVVGQPPTSYSVFVMILSTNP